MVDEPGNHPGTQVPGSGRTGYDGNRTRDDEPLCAGFLLSRDWDGMAKTGIRYCDTSRAGAPFTSQHVSCLKRDPRLPEAALRFAGLP